MRVVLFAESFLPHMNGVTNSVLQMLTHFEHRGHEVLVVAPHPGRAETPPSEVRGARVEWVTSVPLPAYPQVRIAARGIRRLGALIEDFAPDVAHLASPFVLGWQALRACERLGIPTVAVYQTDLPGYAARYGIRATEQLLTSHLSRLHGRATMTLAPSSSAISGLEALGVPRIRHWARGVDTERFTTARRSATLRHELAPNGEVIVGYVGRLAPEKQVHDLVALAGIDGVRLVIVGDGPSRAELEQALPDAAFLGFRGGDELGEIVASFDLFVHPGEHETFCQTVQEALASGVPVVATGAGGPLDLVQSSRTGWLYKPGDLDDMRSRVLDLVGDEAKRVAFAVAARESVAGRSWAALGDELIAHYRDAIRSTPAAKAVEEAPPHWARYVALGDSLTEGLCDTSRQAEGEFRGWADRLATLLAHGRDRAPLEYANLAVRSKRIDELLAEQLPTALRLRPELVSILVGANDVVRVGARPVQLADRLGVAIASLRATGAEVLVVGLFAPPALAAVGIRSRMRVFNARLREHCERHGARFLDFASDPVLRDSTSWAPDRVHLSSRGHRALCYRAAAALGVPGASDIGALDELMHESGPPAAQPRLSSSRWLVSEVVPWVGRRMRGRRAGDGMTAKHDHAITVTAETTDRAGEPQRERASLGEGEARS